jgi:hypothetical protein
VQLRQQVERLADFGPVQPAQTFQVQEVDNRLLRQIDFNMPVFGRTLRGNVGIASRDHRRVDSNGFTNRGVRSTRPTTTKTTCRR